MSDNRNVVPADDSPWQALKTHSQNSDEYVPSESVSRLDEICRVHISFLRPERKGRKIFRSLDQAWLRQSNPTWPTAVKERIYRYIHTHSLYQITNGDDDNLIRLTKSFIAAASLPTIPQVFEEVANRCLSLLQSSVQSWKCQGLIVPGYNNTLVKCPLFQKLWDHAINPPRKRSVSNISAAQSLDGSPHEVNAYQESFTSQLEKVSEDKYPKKRIFEPSQHSANSQTSKRPRECSYVEDDTEDCIIVSLPKASGRDLQTQLIEKEDRDTTPTQNWAPPIIDITGVDHLEVETNSGLHLPSLNLDRDASIPRPSPGKDDQPCQQPGDFTKANISSNPTIYPPPSQQLPDLHIETYCEVESLPSIFSPGPPKNAPEARPMILRDENEHIPPIDSTSIPISLESPAPIAPMPSSNFNSEASIDGLQSNRTDPTLCRLPSSANKGSAVTGRPQSNLEQYSRQRPNSPLVPLVDSIEDHLQIGCSKPTDSEAPATSAAETFLQYSSPYVDHNYRSRFDITTPVTQGGSIPKHDSRPQNQQLRPIVEGNKRHGPSVPINQNPLHEENPPHVSHLPSPISPGSPPPTSASAASSSSIHTLLHLSPTSTSIPLNTSSPRSSSHSAETAFRHPHVIFTDSNNVKCDLTPAQLATLTTPFDRIARICIRKPKCQDMLDADKYFPIGAIMWCELSMFYKWYSKMSLNSNNRLLHVELIDVTCQNERSFIISENHPQSFRLLKQHIWNMFWMESRIRGALEVFTVTIEPYLHVLNNISHDKDRSHASPVSHSAANQAQQAGHANMTDGPSQLPDRNPSNSLTLIPPILRTSFEKSTLRMIATQTNKRPFEDEIAGNGSVLRTEPLSGCGVVIDMRSGAGTMTILSSDNLVINSIKTHPRYPGHPFLDIELPNGYICEVRGYAVILLYHHMPNRDPLPNPLKDTVSIPKTQVATARQVSKPSSVTSPPTPLDPEILIRIQVHPSGKLSPPYHKDVLHPKITTKEFFSWFYNEITRKSRPTNSSTGKICPQKLNELAFRLKDAMPFPKSGFFSRGDEAHFMYMRKLIREQYEKAKVFCPGMREFVVLITIPGTAGSAEFDEEW